jgi:hypothetical protein
MLEFSQSDIDLILSETATGETDSNLGFFSKPFRVNFRNRELIVKKYLPIRNFKIVSEIIKNHERYVEELRKIGIKIPDTIIRTLRIKGKFQIFIIQESFQKGELLRYLLETSSKSELLKLCKLIFDDTLRFREGRMGSMNIGFHPTLRNYALHNGSLFYFDTFPPMLMNQRELNKIILGMSPYGSFFRRFIPLTWMNFISNEYYNLDKMFTGITGSCCRLRQEYTNDILKFSTEYIQSSSCSITEKQKITGILKSPPELPGLWTFFRRLSGNVGKPNIKRL